MVAVEVRQGTVDRHRGWRFRADSTEDEKEEEEEDKADIKSHNPHLTGGELTK